MTDRRLELRIARLLQVGVATAALLALGGGVLVMVTSGGTPADFGTFDGPAAPFRSVGTIAAGALRMDGRAIAQLGILVLIATPLARVALTVGEFLARRDWTYVALTASVLALLLWGLLAGGP